MRRVVFTDPPAPARRGTSRRPSRGGGVKAGTGGKPEADSAGRPYGPVADPAFRLRQLACRRRLVVPHGTACDRLATRGRSGSDPAMRSRPAGEDRCCRDRVIPVHVLPPIFRIARSASLRAFPGPWPGKGPVDRCRLSPAVPGGFGAPNGIADKHVDAPRARQALSALLPSLFCRSTGVPVRASPSLARAVTWRRTGAWPCFTGEMNIACRTAATVRHVAFSALHHGVTGLTRSRCPGPCCYRSCEILIQPRRMIASPSPGPPGAGGWPRPRARRPARRRTTRAVRELGVWVGEQLPERRASR